VTGANELVTLSVVNKPSWLNFNASSGVLSGTPTNDNAGHNGPDTTYQITVKATDKGGLFAEQVFSVKVKNINDAPVVNSQSVLTVAEDNSITIALANLNVTDVDDVYPTDFTLAVQNGSNYNHSGNIVTPFPNYTGTLTIPVKLTDGGAATIDYNVTVTVTPVNDAPVITSTVSNTTINEGVLFTYLFQVTDVDNTPTLSAVKKPSWLVFTPSNGILAGTPKFEDVGKDTITLRASDGTTNVDQTIILTIEKVNHKPVLSGNPQISVDEDQEYLYIPTATDQDGDELVYSAVTIPSWLSFDPATRELKGVPTNDAVGMLSSKNFNVTLRVSDGKETADQSFTITVFAVNDAPEITGQNDTLSFIASANFAITMDKLKVTDPDNPESDLTIEILSGNNYDAVGNIINVTTYRGRLAVNIRVKDKAASSATYKYIVMVEAGTGMSNLKSVNDLVTNVYPIPAFESVTFKFGKIETESAKLQITNNTGKLIKSLPIEAGISNYEFMVNDLPQGIYYYNLVSGKEFQTGKFVVVK
ncbi:MAG: T9SS type A sorting domain-containing protein, partial [Bacteroidales bacterium]|nr:T9SS type A sorting domain-containing protein [Bacteroidales bacterium]